MAAAVAVVAAAVALAGCFGPPGGGVPPDQVRWLVYGDSLSVEAAPYLVGYGSVGNRYAGGVAPCDWMPGLGSAATRYAPQVVLLQFVGNVDTSSCMSGRDRETAYQQDLSRIASFWKGHGVPVVMVISPQTPTDAYGWARDVELGAAQTSSLPVNRAARALLRPDGSYTAFLPCLPSEGAAQGCGSEVAGEIRVKEATFGLHFGKSDPAGTYASGAFRYATAMSES